MPPNQLTQLLHSEIPITRLMQLQITKLDEVQLLMQAPLLPNRNIHHTFFAGSLYTLACAAGWCLTHYELSALDADTDVVLARGDIQYLRPASSDCEIALSRWTKEVKQSVAADLKASGAARVKVKLFIQCQGRRVAEFKGLYVAKKAISPVTC